MADIFQEVDEELRRERLKKLWDRWGNVVVVIAALIVLGVGGWRGWEWWEARKSAQAGDAFEAALALAEGNKHAEAEAAFAKIAADAPFGYRVLARIREAEEASLRDKSAAAKVLDDIAADSRIGAVFQDLAAVRAGILVADTASLDEMRRRLEPLTAADRPFRHIAREMIALAAFRAGDMTSARRWFDMIANDPETPSGTRTRVEILMALAGVGAKS